VGLTAAALTAADSAVATAQRGGSVRGGRGVAALVAAAAARREEHAANTAVLREAQQALAATQLSQASRTAAEQRLAAVEALLQKTGAAARELQLPAIPPADAGRGAPPPANAAELLRGAGGVARVLDAECTAVFAVSSLPSAGDVIMTAGAGCVLYGTAISVHAGIARGGGADTATFSLGAQRPPWPLLSLTSVATTRLAAVPLMAPSLPTTSRTTQFDTVASARRYTATAASSGVSFAQSVAVSASYGTASVGVGLSSSSSRGARSAEEANATSETKTSSVVCAVTVPVASLRLRLEDVELDGHAANALRRVHTLAAAADWLCRFGSHALLGTKHVGGALLYTAHVTAKTAQSASSLQSAAESAIASRLALSASGGFGPVGFSASASASHEEQQRTSGATADSKESSEYRVTVETVVLGPVPMRNDAASFASQLRAAPAAWAVVDHGDERAAVAAWELAALRHADDAELLRAAALLRAAFEADAFAAGAPQALVERWVLPSGPSAALGAPEQPAPAPAPLPNGSGARTALAEALTVALEALPAVIPGDDAANAAAAATVLRQLAEVQVASPVGSAQRVEAVFDALSASGACNATRDAVARVLQHGCNSGRRGHAQLRFVLVSNDALRGGLALLKRAVAAGLELDGAIARVVALALGAPASAAVPSAATLGAFTSPMAWQSAVLDVATARLVTAAVAAEPLAMLDAWVRRQPTSTAANRTALAAKLREPIRTQLEQAAGHAFSDGECDDAYAEAAACLAEALALAADETFPAAVLGGQAALQQPAAHCVSFLSAAARNLPLAATALREQLLLARAFVDFGAAAPHGGVALVRAWAYDPDGGVQPTPAAIRAGIARRMGAAATPARPLPAASCCAPCPSCNMPCSKSQNHVASAFPTDRQHDTVHQPRIIATGRDIASCGVASCKALCAGGSTLAFLRGVQHVRFADFARTVPEWRDPATSADPPHNCPRVALAVALQADAKHAADAQHAAP